MLDSMQTAEMQRRGSTPYDPSAGSPHDVAMRSALNVRKHVAAREKRTAPRGAALPGVQSRKAVVRPVSAGRHVSSWKDHPQEQGHHQHERERQLRLHPSDVRACQYGGARAGQDHWQRPPRAARDAEPALRAPWARPEPVRSARRTLRAAY